MPTKISIRFPLVKVPTGSRTGPRYHRRPDKTGLHGAAACAANLVTLAMSHRDDRPLRYDDPVEHRRRHRMQMRHAALWARVFAGQIDQHDPRIDESQARISALLNKAYFTNAA